MRTYYFLTISILLYFTSCDSNKNNSNIADSMKNAIDIGHKPIAVDSLLARPYNLEILDNYLIWCDIMDNGVLTLFDTQKNKIATRVIKIGNGPNEVIPPFQLSIDKISKRVFILQRQTGTITQYQIDSLLIGQTHPERKITLEAHVDRFEINKEEIITLGDGGETNLSIFNWDKEELVKTSLYPQSIKELNPSLDKYLFGQGYVSFNQQESILAFASSFNDHIGFYRKEENSQFTLIASYGTNNVSIINDRPDHTLNFAEDCYSTDKFTYILYSGKEHASTENGMSYIIQFSPEGKLIKTYKSSTKLYNICVNEKDSKLFGISISPDLDYQIVEFDI